MVGYIVRLTRPSCSRLFRVSVSMRCEMPSIRRAFLWYCAGPFDNEPTPITVHLSPMRASVGITSRHPSRQSEHEDVRAGEFVSDKKLPPCANFFSPYH